MDKIGLEIVMEAGDPVSRRCAKVLLSLVGGFWGDVCVYIGYVHVNDDKCDVDD